MAEEFVAAVEAAGVGTEQPFHAGHQIAAGRFDDQVEMIGHQAKGMHLPGGFGAGFVKRFEEAFTIAVVLKDGFAAVAAVHDVVKGAGVLDAELAGHGFTVNKANGSIKCKK
jgi:hypothetical protein